MQVDTYSWYRVTLGAGWVPVSHGELSMHSSRASVLLPIYSKAKGRNWNGGSCRKPKHKIFLSQWGIPFLFELTCVFWQKLYCIQMHIFQCVWLGGEYLLLLVWSPCLYSSFLFAPVPKLEKLELSYDLYVSPLVLTSLLLFYFYLLFPLSDWVWPHQLSCELSFPLISMLLICPLPTIATWPLKLSS